MDTNPPRYSDPERATFTSLLDTLIPPSPDGRLPGAGELGLAVQLEADAPALHPVIAPGLARLDALAAERGAAGLTALAPGARAEVVERLAGEEPGFLPGLIFHTYVAYYQAPRVVEALGLEARPPHPAGYPLEAGDLDRLEPVRRGPRRYREV